MMDLILDGQILRALLSTLFGEASLEAFGKTVKNYSGASVVFLCDYEQKWNDGVLDIATHLFIVATTLFATILPAGIIGLSIWELGHNRLQSVSAKFIRVSLNGFLLIISCAIGFLVFLNTSVFLDHYEGNVSCTEAIKMYEEQKNYVWEIVE